MQLSSYFATELERTLSAHKLLTRKAETSLILFAIISLQYCILPGAEAPQIAISYPRSMQNKL